MNQLLLNKSLALEQSDETLELKAVITPVFGKEKTYCQVHGEV